MHFDCLFIFKYAPFTCKHTLYMSCRSKVFNIYIYVHIYYKYINAQYVKLLPLKVFYTILYDDLLHNICICVYIY